MSIKYTETLYIQSTELNTFMASLSKSIKIKPTHFYVSFQIFFQHGGKFTYHHTSLQQVVYIMDYQTVGSRAGPIPEFFSYSSEFEETFGYGFNQFH